MLKIFSKIIIKNPLFFFILIAFAHPSCASPPSSVSMQPLKIQKIDSSFVALQVEVADSDEERMKGLMFRKSLNENEGMLFVFDRDTDGPFWMKDTPLSLDIIFINSQNQVVWIEENTTPFSEELIRSKGGLYRFALEVKAGFARVHQIQKGDIIIH